MRRRSIIINQTRYKIIDELGKGAFGIVYKIKNGEDILALKEIILRGKTEEEINKIKNEAKILSGIENDHIVKYHDSYQDKEAFYIFMEYCDGNLETLIKEYKNKKKTIDINIIYDIILNICLGIREIHQKDIIHRDLKPENIFITKEKKIKIGDFGVSKQLSTNNQYASTGIGTLIYMAPELLSNKKHNNKVDIWSLGCIIYELLTLKKCFDSEDSGVLGVINNITTANYERIDRNKYNSKWQDLIDLLFKIDYKERPNIDEVINYLKNELSEYGKKMIRLSNYELQEEKKNVKCKKSKNYNFIYLYSIIIRRF